MHWYCCNDAVPWLNEAKGQFFDLQWVLKLTCNLSACHLPAWLPAVRPSSTRYTASEILDSQSNDSGFTNLLFWLTFVHCAMVIPFILHNPSLLFCISLNKARNLPKKVLINSWYLFMMSHKICDWISQNPASTHKNWSPIYSLTWKPHSSTIQTHQW